MNTNKAAKRLPTPPFTFETATQKVRLAEDMWNTRDPAQVVMGYTEHSLWRNRNELINGKAAILEILNQKWTKELQYRLIKELWAFSGNKLAVRFAYEWCDISNNWFRSYGNENWEFDENGFMQRRIASINDLAISKNERKYAWPLGRRPDNHTSLSQLDL